MVERDGAIHRLTRVVMRGTYCDQLVAIRDVLQATDEYKNTSRSHTHTRTHARTHTHTHTLSLSLSLSHYYLVEIRCLHTDVVWIKWLISWPW